MSDRLLLKVLRGIQATAELAHGAIPEGETPGQARALLIVTLGRIASIAEAAVMDYEALTQAANPPRR